MDTAVTRVERAESRNTAITSTAMPRPSRPSTKRVSMDCSMNGAWSNTTERRAPSPASDSSSGRMARTDSETATRSASGVAVTLRDSVSTPSVRVTDVGSAAPRETSATSPSRCGARAPGPPPPASAGAAEASSAGTTVTARRSSRSSTGAPAWTG